MKRLIGMLMITTITFHVWGAESDELEKLKRKIQIAKLEKPKIFYTIQSLKKRIRKLDQMKRGIYAVVAPYLCTLKSEGLLPMLHHLLNPHQLGEGMNEIERIAWTVGLLEAVGSLRDSRSTLVLEKFILEQEHEPCIERAAAEALGKIGTDRAITFLIDLAVQPGSEQMSVLYGLGEARRIRSAVFLADLTSKNYDPQKILLVIRALGCVGNSWAWQTKIISSRGEGDATRRIAAKALVRAFVNYFEVSELKQAIVKSLLLVDHPISLELIQSERLWAKPKLSKALDYLINQLANNPLHGSRQK